MNIKTLTTLGALAAMAFTGSAFAQTTQTEADQAKDGASKTWEGTKETTHHGWEATKDGTKDAWNDTKEGSKEAWNKTKDKSKEAWHDTKGAAREGANDTSDALAAKDEGTIRGTLTKVDDDELTVKDARGNEVALKRDAKTDISANKDKAQLREGDEVRANFKVDENGDKWVQTVKVTAQDDQKADTQKLDNDNDQDDQAPADMK